MGMVMAAEPGMIALSAIEIVGFPPEALPLVTPIWSDVPRIETLPIEEPPTTFRRPVPLTDAKAAGSPESAIVGLPVTPLLLVTPIPLPELAIDRGTITPLTLTTMPSPADSRLPEVPLRNTVKGPCAPPSVNPIPVLPDRYRLLGRAGVWIAVRY